MPLFGPETTWAFARPVRLLLPALLAALTLACAAAVMAPTASAQEVPADVSGEVAPVIPEPTSEPAPPPEQPPSGGDPAPPPEPPPAPAPPPPPESQEPASDPATPAADEHRQAPSDGNDHTASPASEPVTYTPVQHAPDTPTASPDQPAVTTAPLGWDVYDDALVADLGNNDNGTGGIAGGAPPAIRALHVLGSIRTAGTAAKQQEHGDTKPASRAAPVSGGGSGPGGSAPGQGPSLGLFGAGGGSGAGVAFLMLLGMACGWLLLAPDRMRAFLTSTAMWRLSAYVPPIEHPG